jgi:hypothetical protein
MIIPNTYDNPRFYNKKVQEINTDLNVLGWIESIFPVTKIGIDEEGTFPEVYKNDGGKTSVRVLPTGKSLSFFVVNDPLTQIEETESYSTELSLIVWADLTQVYPDKDYDYTDELINDCRRVLNRHGAYNYSVELEDVFDGYSQLEKLTNQNVMLPNTAFKITFTVSLTMCISTDTPIVFDLFLLSAEVGSVSDDLIVLTYNNTLDSTSVPAVGDFSLSGTSSVVSSVAISGSTVRLTLDETIFIHETVTIGYTAGTNPIRDENEKNAANLVNKSVTNNSTTYQTGLWSLPSLDETYQMYVNLAAEGVGGFNTLWYWTSTEFNATIAKKVLMLSGANGEQSKGDSSQVSVRAFRTFIASAGAFSLRDVGPGGGLVFYIDGTTYYEAYATDQSTSYIWSNVNTAIGTTGTAIGDGAQNTLDIINQAGHTTSAAKLCNDLN